MRNVWLIFRRDARNLFRNVMSVIITVGLVVLPSLFAWCNILACWNVFDNTGNLSVAVANDDAGYESDLLPINVNIGEKVVSALHENDQNNWVFTDSEDAIEGTRAGTYYAALVIPENFSTDMLTFYEGDSASARIDYYVNDKVNAIAPNITGTGADTVSYEVNKTFAETISEIAVAIAQSLSQMAEDDDVSGRIADLAEHMRGVADRLDQSADVLGLYASLAKDSKGLVESSAELVGSAKSQAQAAASDIDDGKQRLRDLANRISSTVDVVSDALDEAKEDAGDAEGKANDLLEKAMKGAGDIAGKLREKADDIDGKADRLAEARDVLVGLRDELKNGADMGAKKDFSKGNVDVAISAEVEVMYEDTVLLDADIAALTKAIDILRKASAACTDAAESLESWDPKASEKVERLKEKAKEAKENIEAELDDLEEKLKPGVEKLKRNAEKLVEDLNSGVASIGALGPELSDAVGAAASALGDAGAKVDDASGKLHTSAQSVRSLADAVDEALATGDVETLKSLLQGNAGDLPRALSAPVQVERTALFPVASFGSAMTPLYSTLALFIGSLLIMVAMKPEVSARGKELLDNPKPRHLYFGRFGVVALISLMQTTLLGFGNMCLLKVQVAEPLLFMLAFWIAGLVFAFIVYTLVVSFGNLGKAIAVVLLVVQVTGCNGSYPVVILPDFVQAVSPWLPATYVVKALYSAMLGEYQNDFWVAIGHLLLFLILFLLFGLVLRKPMERFMKFYVSKVEECKIME